MGSPLEPVTVAPTVLARFKSKLLVRARSAFKKKKTRSLGQILEKTCEHDRDHSFDPIIIKFGQNVCLHKISVPFESGLSLDKN